ncbi:MAG: hypothetical protein A3J24_00140 [Deltaproteobacteria bacterium RIFCSPLOWO2_02_FULL_53_8]|nr:MAG: hypothetical protein A3J24_00140 [Deltaproteobacteria bacterium RIFCSPLOWO2_02_FULL_53_8]
MDSPFEKTVCDAYDALWGVMVAGDAQYPVSSEIARLPRMRREVLKTIVCNPGISVYDLANKTQRDYSRVLKDVRLLIEMIEVESRPDPRSSRKARQLVPMRSINARLAEIALS